MIINAPLFLSFSNTQSHCHSVCVCVPACVRACVYVSFHILKKGLDMIEILHYHLVNSYTTRNTNHYNTDNHTFNPHYVSFTVIGLQSPCNMKWRVCEAHVSMVCV